MTLLNETDILGQYLEKEVSPMPHQGKWGLIWGHAPLAQLSPPPPSPPCLPGLLLLLAGVRPRPENPPG